MREDLLQDYRKDYMGAIYHYRQYERLRPDSEKKALLRDRTRVCQQLLVAQLLLRTEGELTAFTLATATGVSLTVNLDAKLLASINTLLVDVVRKVDWGLLHPASPTSTEAPILH